MSESTLPPRPMPLWQILILVTSGGCLLYLAGNDLNGLRARVVIAAAIISIIPFINGSLMRVLDRIRNPSPRRRWETAIALGAAGAVYLMGTALLQQRTLVPKMEDECSYALGAQMLAHGHLWMQSHPLADFFESLFVIVKPVYCSIYFPGTAMFFAPTFWFGWPTWVLPLTVAGGVIALIYRVTTELVDGVAGLLACFWVIALGQFRTLSMMMMSHLPMLLLGLLMFWAWLRWRREKSLRWALLLGVFSGWAAITRPADAAAYAAPIGIAILVDQWRDPVRRKVMTAGAIVCGAAPFLALQITFNMGVTGRPLQSPYTYSLQKDQPGAEYGFHHYDPRLEPQTTSRIKLAYYGWNKIYFEQHQFPRILLRWVSRDSDLGGLHDSYLTIIADNTLPTHWLLLLLPAGLLALAERRTLVLSATFFAFCVIYFFNPFFLSHYPLIVAPAIIVCILLGAQAVAGRRSTRRLGVPVTIVLLTLPITSLWEFKQFSFHDDRELMEGRDGMLESSKIALLNAQLMGDVGDAPAVVLFGPQTASFFEEPVYNIESADIDSSPIIRANDLGERNIEIIRYYAERQPQRVFYLCDARIPMIDRMGTAVELMQRIKQGQTLPTLAAPTPPSIMTRQ